MSPDTCTCSGRRLPHLCAREMRHTQHFVRVLSPPAGFERMCGGACEDSRRTRNPTSHLRHAFNKAAPYPHGTKTLQLAGRLTPHACPHMSRACERATSGEGECRPLTACNDWREIHAQGRECNLEISVAESRAFRHHVILAMATCSASYVGCVSARMTPLTVIPDIPLPSTPDVLKHGIFHPRQFLKLRTSPPDDMHPLAFAAPLLHYAPLHPRTSSSISPRRPTHVPHTTMTLAAPPKTPLSHPSEDASAPFTEEPIREISGVDAYLAAAQQSHDTLVVLMVYAPWCRSCRALKPKMNRLAREYENVVFCKMNFEENKELCHRLGVMSMPTFLYYMGCEGCIEKFSCGPMRAGVIREKIDQCLRGLCLLPGYEESDLEGEG